MPLSIQISSMMALLLAGASLLADINLPVPALPQGDARTERVLRGGQVAIELRAHYGGSDLIQFAIVRPPRRGRLSGLRTSGSNRANITYTHDGGRADDGDGSAYVIQTGGRVSSPAEVRIFVDEVPARLQAPEQIDFGETVAGESITRELPIHNAGGGVLEGSLRVSSPWTSAPEEYRVPAGETETATIAFRPNEAKKFVGQIMLTSGADGSATVSLTGTATAAVDVAPNPLVFSAPPRPEVISLTNLTDSTVNLEFQASAHLQPIDEITLSAREKKRVTIEVRAEVTGPLREILKIAGPRFEVPLQIEAPALLRKGVVKSEQPATLRPTVSPVATIVASAPIPRVAITPPPPSAAPKPLLNPAVKVNARRAAASRWELQWPAAKTADAAYRIDERLLSLDSAGKLQISWRTLAAAKITRANPVTAEIGGLDSRELHLLRVTALGPDEAVLWESPPVALAPAPARSHHRVIWLLGLGSALALFLILRWRARHDYSPNESHRPR